MLAVENPTRYITVSKVRENEMLNKQHATDLATEHTYSQDTIMWLLSTPIARIQCSPSVR